MDNLWPRSGPEVDLRYSLSSGYAAGPPFDHRKGSFKLVQIYLAATRKYNFLNIIQIKETCLYSRNLDEVHRFYHDLLGFPVISYLEGKHIFFRAGSSVLLCFNPDDSRKKQSPPPHFAEGKYHLAFEVPADEYETHKKEIVSKGINILDTVVWDTGQESFYFADPEGNVLEIVPVGIWR